MKESLKSAVVITTNYFSTAVSPEAVAWKVKLSDIVPWYTTVSLVPDHESWQVTALEIFRVKTLPTALALCSITPQ